MKNITKVFEQDWLGTKPIFYNKKTRKVSLKILDVIDWSNFCFSSEGLCNYLDFGYNVFGLTPFKNVFMLKSCEKLICFEDGSLTIESTPDPANRAYPNSSVKTGIEYLKNYLEIEQKKIGDMKLLLPLSGGYDSRLLGVFANKTLTESATYSIDTPLRKCSEVLIAKDIAAKLGIKWHHVFIDQFFSNKYQHLHYNHYGPSMSLHATYHLDFYNKLKQKLGGNYAVLSGSVGDWWSRLHKHNFKRPESPKDFRSLFFNSEHFDVSFCKLKNPLTISTKEFEIHHKKLKDLNYQTLFMARNRISFVRWIYESPSLIFPKVITPFFDADVAFNFLYAKDKEGWQDKFFRERGIFPNKNYKRGVNCLDIDAARNSLHDLLDVTVLSEIIKPERLDWINNTILDIKKKPRLYYQKIAKYRERCFKALGDYIILKPLEYVLYRRDSGGDIIYPA